MAMSDYEEVPVIDAARRCGVRWAPWMGDWFVSWSPRNDNSNAEGRWDHWVELAVAILQDPMTQIVRPEAFAAAAGLARFNFDSESNRALTEAEVASRFGPETPSDTAEAVSR